MEEIYQIYDKAVKRILTLSNKAVINLINGLFGTNYPTDSIITYNWTEHEDKDLKRTLSDSILTINGRDSYHIEAQMTEDEGIVFRVFEYGFGHAYKNRVLERGGERMIFPQPCIIYLDEGKKDRLPDEYTLILQFKNQGEFTYKVPVVKLQNISLQELHDKKLIVLLPFLLLKLRKRLEKMRTKENLEELQCLVMNDIIRTINRNEEMGNISRTDALDLIDLTTKLYLKIYSKYKELEDFTMRLYDQSMELASDKYEKTVEELEDEVAKMQDILVMKDESLREKDESLREKDGMLKEQERIIRDLERRLQEAQGKNKNRK